MPFTKQDCVERKKNVIKKSYQEKWNNLSFTV